MSELEKISREYAITCHAKTNHFYSDKPYSFHLEMVYNFGLKYIYLIPKEYQDAVLAACWTHDVIEDCRQTYNNVKNACGVTVADITYALTNEKGKTRKERANAKYYQGIKDVQFATFVKLCDRLANITYSKHTGGDMINAYRTENTFFKKSLWDEKYFDMFKEIENLISLDSHPDMPLETLPSIGGGLQAGELSVVIGKEKIGKSTFIGDRLPSGYNKNIADIMKQEAVKRLSEALALDESYPFKREEKPCLHDACNECHGSGRKKDGTTCFHYISCPCPKCNAYFL